MELPSEATRPHPPASAGDWALFLDVDGCLLDFAATPDGVSVPAVLPATLEALAERFQGALAMISGRALATLDELFPTLRHLPAAGLHGLERRGAGGSCQAALPAPTALTSVHAEAEGLAAAWPGAVVERKGPNLALHWRAAPQAAPAFHALATAALPRLPGYRLQAGDQLVELRPDAGADKGTAILAFLQEAPFRGRLPVFVGDDLTDEQGFGAVNACGGISVLVGTRARSAAHYGLCDPASVRAWLQMLAAGAAQAVDTQGDAQPVRA